ncbi:hypothetical protein JCM19240_5010 [Vibrio maritimus]|uniref:Uncharacterized protein n=1 Tax=Vibrio maritimus TaxID=990268 RepID=A0A090SYN3_9VIBR|nr:hypothetical protein JCM19240_5010 [Vibrio maritimus]
MRGDDVLDASNNPILQLGDVIGVRGEYSALIKEGEAT